MMYFNILGTKIAPINILDVVIKIEKFISNNIKNYITITGVHGLIEALYSYEVRIAHNRAALSVPDGMPLVWIGKLKGFKNLERCYGPDLMLEVIEDSLKNKYKHFFYGGANGVAELLKEKMEEKYPGVQIVGTYTPPFHSLNQMEEKEFIQQIFRLKPDIIWVGLSTPKQEIFMYEYLPKLDTKLMIGVGAAFDFHTGRVKQAPRWMQRSGLEWFYRIIADPKRLWKRYAKNNPLFIWHIILQLLKLKNYHLTD